MPYTLSADGRTVLKDGGPFQRLGSVNAAMKVLKLLDPAAAAQTLKEGIGNAPAAAATQTPPEQATPPPAASEPPPAIVPGNTEEPPPAQTAEVAVATSTTASLVQQAKAAYGKTFG